VTDKFLTAREVAELFHRNIRTVYRWIHEGHISQAYKVRDGFLIPESEVEKLKRDANESNI
jgi:excisionase family DNA binding protein